MQRHKTPEEKLDFDFRCHLLLKYLPRKFYISINLSILSKSLACQARNIVAFLLWFLEDATFTGTRMAKIMVTKCQEDCYINIGTRSLLFATDTLWCYISVWTKSPFGVPGTSAEHVQDNCDQVYRSKIDPIFSPCSGELKEEWRYPVCSHL